MFAFMMFGQQPREHVLACANVWTGGGVVAGVVMSR
jgi:hypothetical protein